MLCDIAAESTDIALLMQYTGSMGVTLNGVGFSTDISNLLSNLNYDFDGATDDNRISFGFFSPNTAMGQNTAPGSEAISLIYDAIADAHETHVIHHPLDYEAFGYPAYDYDWWILERNTTTSDSYWNSGWYNGYWSYWTGDTDLDNLGYSGLGMSSVDIADGDVHAWKFASLINESDIDGRSGASTQWLAPNYTHKIELSGVNAPVEDNVARQAHYYRLDGIEVSADNLTPGIYIVRRGHTSSKQIIF